jgi:hypothetical protein
MVWELRSYLRRHFALNFSDADAVANQKLNHYEEILFLNRDISRPVNIPKTQLHGDLYNEVMTDGVKVQLPRPFIFSLSVLEDHPIFVRSKRPVSKTIVLYDNAGEHFEPGQDSFKDPVTLHLTRSSGLLFLLDPTQHAKFRAHCSSPDPQVAPSAKTQRQDVLLTEMASRIRRHKGLNAEESSEIPLVVVVSKYDVWKNLLRQPVPRIPWRVSKKDNIAALDLDKIFSVSVELRQLIERFYPEFVTAAEASFENICYVPNSALGHSPKVDASSQELRVTPGDISPVWASVPMLYLLWSLNYIFRLAHSKEQDVPCATLVSAGCGRLNIRVPDSSIVLEVPRLSQGSVLICPTTGKVFRVPQVSKA